MTWAQRLRAFIGWYPAYTAEAVLAMPNYRFLALVAAAVGELPGSPVELARAEAQVAEMRRLRAARTGGDAEQHHEAEEER